MKNPEVVHGMDQHSCCHAAVYPLPACDHQMFAFAYSLVSSRKNFIRKNWVVVNSTNDFGVVTSRAVACKFLTSWVVHLGDVDVDIVVTKCVGDFITSTVTKRQYVTWTARSNFQLFGFNIFRSEVPFVV